VVYKQPVLVFDSSKKSAKRSVKSSSYNPPLLVSLAVFNIIALNIRDLELRLGFWI
jgi:hypothetical protein